MNSKVEKRIYVGGLLTLSVLLVGVVALFIVDRNLGEPVATAGASETIQVEFVPGQGMVEVKSPLDQHVEIRKLEKVYPTIFAGYPEDMDGISANCPDGSKVTTHDDYNRQAPELSPYRNLSGPELLALCRE